MSGDKKLGAMAAAIGFDISYVAMELLVEEGLWNWISHGVSAIICLLGFYVLCLSLDYSMNFKIGEGHRDIPEQLGIQLHPILKVLLGGPYMIIFMTSFIMVSLGFPVMCVHEMLVAWYDPKGIDSLDSAGFGKLFLVVLMFFTLYFTFNMGGHFKRRKQWSSDLFFFRRILPVIGVVVGASVSHLGGVMLDQIELEKGVEAMQEWAPTAYITLYFPMRYIITRTLGVSWLSLLIAVGTIVTLGFIGG